MNYLRTVGRDIINKKAVYLMVLPLVIYLIVFSYMPMYGIIIAFKDYSPYKGILASEWAGLDYFRIPGSVFTGDKYLVVFRQQDVTFFIAVVAFI